MPPACVARSWAVTGRAPLNDPGLRSLIVPRLKYAIPMDPRISALVCTRNGAGHVGQTLRSLSDQSLDGAEYEIVVVDNGSTDDTKREVEQFAAATTGVRYEFEPEPGLNRARNRAWQNARGEVVAFLDDDATACPDWLERILGVFASQKPRPGCVGGSVGLAWDEPPPDWLTYEFRRPLAAVEWETAQWLPDARSVVGCNMAFDRALLSELGGFLPGMDRTGRSLLSNGDILMQKLVRRTGRGCYYDPAIAVTHRVRRDRVSPGWFVKRSYWQGVSNALMNGYLERPGWRGRLSSVGRELRLGHVTPARLVRLALGRGRASWLWATCPTAASLGVVNALLGVHGRV